MCHRSQAADKAIKDLTQVYEEGDLVKAVVLKVGNKAVVKSHSEYIPPPVTALSFALRSSGRALAVTR